MIDTRAPRRFSTGLVALAAAAGLLLAACGGDDGGGKQDAAKSTAQGAVGNFVGRASSADAFVALSVADAPAQAKGGREVLAYVCNGKEIGQWFRGEAGKDGAALTAASGARLEAKLSANKATGTVTLSDGRKLAFDASPATGDAGLYRARGQVAGADVLAGWVLLPDGEQRGTLQQAGTIGPAPKLNPTSPTVQVSGGTLPANTVNSFMCCWFIDG